MIATPATVKREPAATAVPDPRRSHDRGIWVGQVAGEDEKTNGDKRIDITTVSFDELRRELDRREKGLEALKLKRAKLAQELAAIDAQLRELQVADRPARRPSAGRDQPARLALPRMRNSIRLPDAVALEAEVGQVVTPPEIAKRVLASGFQSRSKTFTAMVTHALSNDKRFRRVGRGRYERVAMAATN